MRMWNVSPIHLCRKHLLGEHLETHMFVSSINLNKKLDGFIKNGLLEIHNLKQRHDDLAEEMEIRGYNHKSPLPEFEEREVGHIDTKNSYDTLMERCSECRKRMFLYE